MIIGITGKSGSGKTHIAKQIAKERNLTHIDIDRIGHEVMDMPHIQNELVSIFGQEILDRRKRADIVLNNRDAYEQVKEIVWPEMQRLIDKAIVDSDDNCVLDWILLPHSKYAKMCDEINLVKRPENERIASAIERDGITWAQMMLRDKNSIEYDERQFDKVIDNKTIKRAIMAGSFDPFTNGHLYIYQQVLELFDEIAILIAHNPLKQRLTAPEIMRDAIIETIGYGGVFVEDGLVADFCEHYDIKYLVRGLRGTSDYLYEEQIAKINEELNPNLKTVYFRASDDCISSTMVKELLRCGRDISKYVPEPIMRALKGEEQ